MSSKTTPPTWLLRFFRWFCHPDFQEDIEGDLLEIFTQQVAEKGPQKAKWYFLLEVVSLIKLNLLRPFKSNTPFIPVGMYKNYFKIAWRNLYKQKLYAFINIGGLAIGLTCFLLIFVYVQHEHSYDRFYPNSNRIYRVYQQQVGNIYSGSDYFAVTPAGLASVLKNEYPEVTQATTIEDFEALLGREKAYFWEKGLWADKHFFQVFEFPFLQGNPRTALTQKESIVLTASLAEKIFGKQNPIGQKLSFQNNEQYTVTGVIQNPPVYTSFQFSFIINIEANANYSDYIKKETWNSNAYHTFFTLNEQADSRDLQRKMPALVEKHVDYGENFAFESTYLVQPLHDLHLQTNINFDIGLKGNPRYLNLFSLIALIVLLLACINYMNLAIARSIRRAKEVGLRKAVGAQRSQIISQFLLESIMITALALSLAWVLTQLLLPIFGQFVERPLVLDVVATPWLLLGLFFLMVLVGILSGSYPALFMSSLNPVEVLKGKLSKKNLGIQLQRWLIIGQYAASITLIISSLIIYHQFQYIQHKELGYETEHILSIQVQDPSLNEEFKVMKEEWLQQPQVLEVSTSQDLPVNSNSNTVINNVENFDDKSEIIIYNNKVDYNYIDLFGLELLAGRNFSPDFGTDAERKCILNERAVKALGWTTSEAVGKQFYRMQDPDKYTVIGVMKDFHTHSLHLPIEPMMLMLKEQLSTYVSVKVSPENLPQTIAVLEETMAQYSPYPFNYSFMDDQFDQLYKADLKLGKTFNFFTMLAILIASLGLFGLAAFTTKQKTKEIGVRKVMGATAQHITHMLTKDFLKMVIIGFVLAIPVAWYFMRQWLEDFTYRIQLQWWMFALGGIIAVIIAFLTVGFQSFKAALTNPVEALRNE